MNKGQITRTIRSMSPEQRDHLRELMEIRYMANNLMGRRTDEVLYKHAMKRLSPNGSTGV